MNITVLKDKKLIFGMSIAIISSMLTIILAFKDSDSWWLLFFSIWLTSLSYSLHRADKLYRKKDSHSP